MQSTGVSILFVSHKLDEVFEIAERFTVFRNGENVVTDFTQNVDNDKFIYYMTGRRIEEDFFVNTVSPQDEVLFKVENLSLKNAFKNISFQVHEGEILGITGLLGSGRTELAMSLFGLLPADSGDVFLDGKRIEINSPPEAIKNKIGYVPEDRLIEGLFLNQPIKKNIAVANIDNMLTAKGTIDTMRIDECLTRWREELTIVMGEGDDEISTLFRRKPAKSCVQAKLAGYGA